MESNFQNRDFERFVRQNADQYRMFPSERVWDEIHATLHTRKRRWVAIGLSALLITGLAVTGIMLLQGHKEKPGIAAIHFAPGPFTPANQSVAANPNRYFDNGPVQPSNSNNPFVNSAEGVQQILLTKQDHTETLTGSLLTYTDNNPEPAAGRDLSSDKMIADVDILPKTVRQNIASPVNTTITPVQTDISKPVNAINTTTEQPEAGLLAANKTGATKKDKEDLKLPLIPSRETATADPLKKRSPRKPEWMLYFTPTVSYRTLSENIDFLSAARYNSIVNGGAPVAYPSDVNTMVNHRPDLGFQLGLRSTLPLSKWFSFTAGIQLGVSKYDIKAYEHPAEMTTIALSDRNLSTVSNFRNTNGYKENWLRNFYFAASLPVGMELRLSDGDKNYFGIAGTLQPTYVLDNRAYLISSDYKNYAEIPSLTRRVNMNTSFEIFAAQRTGKVNWRIGPQVRYQLISSFSKNYPIKEHLFDFGLKLGIQLK